MITRMRQVPAAPSTFRSRLAMAALSVALGSGCVTTQPPEGGWLGSDKALHYFISAGIAAFVYTAAREDGESMSDAFNHAMVVTLSVGASKEAYDEFVSGTGWDWKDFTWDILGALTGGGLASQ